MMPLNHKNKKGFTLIELLVVIAVIGILSTLAIVALGNARTKARDAKRVADIKQISTALELYYADNGNYPTIITPGNSLVSPDGTKSYMATVPNNPTPMNDGDCPNKDYSYGYVTSTNKYALGFCLGNGVSALSAGVQTASTDTGIGNTGLVGWWKFDEGSGTAVTDSSGRGNNGAWNGSGVHYAAGKVGNFAGQFNGSDDYVLLPNGFTGRPPYTYSGWFYSSTVQSNYNAIFASNNIGSGLIVYVGKFCMFVYADGANSACDISAQATNQWVYVTGVVDDRGKKSVYVNGILKDYQVATTVVNHPDYVWIGRGTSSAYISGLIDDVRVYNRALSDAEVLALYNATK